MPTSSFDWDKHFSDSTWNDIQMNSPFFNCQRLPSLINKKEGLIYISSLDLAYSLSDANDMESALPRVKTVFERALETKNYYKAAAAESDFHTIKSLLSDMGILNSDLLES